MLRYMISLKWDGFIRSTIVAAFEAYGSALVGIAPLEMLADGTDEPSDTNVPLLQRS